MILYHLVVSLVGFILIFFFVFKPEDIQGLLTNALWGKTNEKSLLIRYYKSKFFKAFLRLFGILVFLALLFTFLQ